MFKSLHSYVYFSPPTYGDENVLSNTSFSDGRKLAYSFWQYLMSRLRGDDSVPYLPDVIRARASLKTEVQSIPLLCCYSHLSASNWLILPVVIQKLPINN